MTTLTSRSTQYACGLALVAAIAAVGIWGAGLREMEQLGLSALTLAIVIGIALGNTVFPRIAPFSLEGVEFAKSRLLRLGVVLYGFRITFQDIGHIGWAGILIDVLIICATFTLAVQLGTRVFGLDRQSAMLIGAGSSICGAAAVMAAEPVVRGQAHKVSVAVATVVIFGTLGMFVYPLLYPYLHLSETAYGLYAGSTIHEVAQVVVAGRAVSQHAASYAVIEKMLRVMMLAPFLVILGSRLDGQDYAGSAATGRRITIPWFAVFFIVAAGVNSLHLLPAGLVAAVLKVDTVLLAMAMAALGLRTHVGAIRQAGVKPILLASVLFLFLMTGGYVINRIVTAII
ncbi:YeiH family protein [Massilia horti]|uniref:YeiH family putative sulfate export transporter n=1 Tax=Massilia horti TaxID=2562153 RepID=A0A4Y9SWL9_9BURK|nr:YeiH family protein [Massilia horti]TFW30868.1 YeiH family putative sulfate export transporter [Massilia horti]